MAGENKVREIVEFSEQGVDVVARGFGVVASATASLGSQLASLTGIAAGVSGALATVAGYMSANKILEYGAAFENVSTRMAGTLEALGFASDFNQGLEVAAHTMDQIYAAAAKLPGEAEDYIEVFTGSLAVLESSVGGSLDHMLDFSNRYTAVAKSLQIDTMQASNDLQRILQSGKGGAGLDVRTYTKLLPFFKQLEGQAGLTSEAFNRMSDTKRYAMLEQVLKKLDPMVEHMSNSWDAVSGAWKTAERQMVRLGTTEAFDSIKRSVQAMADMIMGSNGKLTGFGQTLANLMQMLTGPLGRGLERMALQIRGWGDGLSTQIKRALGHVEEFREGLGVWALKEVGAMPWVQKLDDMFMRGLQFKDKLGLGAESSTGAKVAGGALGAGAMGAAVGLMPGGFLIKAILGPLATSFGAAMGPMLGGMLEKSGAMRALESFGDLLWGLQDTFVSIGSAVWDAFASIDTDVISGFFTMFRDAGASFITGFVEFTDSFAKYILPYIVKAFGLLGVIVVQVVDTMGKLLGMLAKWMERLNAWGFGEKAGVGTWRGKRGMGTIGQDELAELKGGGRDYLAANKFAGSENFAGKSYATPVKAGQTDWFGGPMSKLLEGLIRMPKAVEHALGGEGKGKTPPKRPNGNTVQDFRGSRFTIAQSFEKDWDPDRIAVAFAKDVRKIGEQRLSSGLEPLGGIY